MKNLDNENMSQLSATDKEVLDLTFRSLAMIRNIARSSQGDGLDPMQTKAILELADASHELPRLVGESKNPVLKSFTERTKSAIALYSAPIPTAPLTIGQELENDRREVAAENLFFAMKVIGGTIAFLVVVGLLAYFFF
ncbi:hypothetical protein AB7B51_17410 [Acinetobacter baumannii]|uniref:hypothetical protein n=1 Tax=Acinetobacter baumannii TaxID=470 RepID=UPI0034E2759C